MRLLSIIKLSKSNNGIIIFRIMECIKHILFTNRLFIKIFARISFALVAERKGVDLLIQRSLVRSQEKLEVNHKMVKIFKIPP